jgi:hypothetical protein
MGREFAAAKPTMTEKSFKLDRRMGLKRLLTIDIPVDWLSNMHTFRLDGDEANEPGPLLEESYLQGQLFIGIARASRQ